MAKSKAVVGTHRVSVYHLLLFLLIAVFSVECVRAAEQAAERGEPIELFDGKTLSGWVTGDGKPVSSGWTVQDGAIYRESRGGHIYFEREFGDFEFSFDWKIAERGNSGVKYKVRHYGNRLLGCEYQVFGDKGNSLSKGSAGALYALYEPNEKKKLNAPDEWNTAKIVVQGSRFEHWLNGEKIVEADTNTDQWRERLDKSKFSPHKDFSQNRFGRIMLQDHGSAVWFRNLTLVPFGTQPIRATTDKPNIVFIFVDDMGYGDLSCTGNKDVQTTNIDKLAKDGIRFTQFYVNSPICSPSRVAVTTGQYPARHLIHSYLASRKRNRARGMRDFLDPAAPCIARQFQNAGYSTAHFGKWHMGGGRDVDDAPLPQAYGFDESLVSFEGLGDRVLPPGGLSKQSEKLGRGKIIHAAKHEQTGIYVDRCIDFVHRNKDRAFYLHLWLNDVHDAHVPSEEMLKKYHQFKDNPLHQKFYAVLDAVDRQVGRLVDAIDSQGLAERTLIVLTSDNGPTAWPRYYKEGHDPPGSTAGFRGRKWSLYEGGIRMPLIARWKGRIEAGSTNEKTVVAAIDFMPTLCSLAQVGLPKVRLDGEDLSAALFGKTPARKNPIVWEYGRNATFLKPGAQHDQSPNLAIRDGRWKLLINDDGSSVELYDFDDDTTEEINVADQYKNVAGRLSQQVLAWRKSLPSLKP